MQIIKYFKDKHNDKIYSEKITDEFIAKMAQSGRLDLDDIYDYLFKCGGYHKLKKKNLNKIIAAMPRDILCDEIFDMYKSVLKNESNKIIEAWTWIVGIATVINLIIAFMQYSK